VTLRNRELLNLIAVGALTTIGFAAVYIASQDVPEFDTTSLTYAAFFLALFVAAHVVLRITLPLADPYLLPIGGLLTAIGLTMIYRIKPDLAFRQGVWVVIGVGFFALACLFLRDYRILDRYKYICGLGAIGLLCLPALPVLGQEINGARLWVDVGGISFQPGEFAKVLLVVFLAGYLRDNREMLSMGKGRLGLPSAKHLGPLLLVWGGAMLVLFQTNDLGGGLLLFSIFLAMLYVATGRALYVGAGLALFVAGAAVLYNAIGHVQDRVTIWLQPWTDEKVYCALNGQLELRQDCGSYQLVKSLYSIGNGGFWGTGLGEGTFNSTDGSALIPYLRTDFIFSAIAQELGLVGAAALLLVFMLFVVRGMRIALRGQDGFSKLLAAGLTFGFALQAFIIVGGVLRVVPLTGITLPFVSYGGTSIVANFLLLAGLLLVSDRANAQEP
jgi:cell division protein FtsW (lipid II flippase)